MKNIKDIKPQIPAEGIMETGLFGDAKIYRISCKCGNDSCEHSLEVEIDDLEVSVNLYVDVFTDFWSKNRFKQIWEILTTGKARMEASIVMSPQQSVNYGNVLISAPKDLEEMRNLNET